MLPERMIAQGVATALMALLCAALPGSSRAHAQSVPDTDNGRFTLSPVPDGFLRLDTRTGAVSTCSNKNGWVCRLVPDERAALDSEIGRLQTDNRRLKDELAQRDAANAKAQDKAAVPQDKAVPKDDPKTSAQAAPDIKASPDGKPSSGGKIELQLPPEHEKILALLDRVWDRLIEMAVRLQKRLSEKI